MSAFIERMRARWDAPVYVFYAEATVAYPPPQRRLAHAFRCEARGCKQTIYRYVGTKDVSSTGNLLRHARSCWGEEAIAAAREAKDLDEIREKIVGSIKKNGSITAAFKRKGKGETYSHRPFTKIETRTECVKWCAESLRPFRVVQDRGFLRLVKTGRPGYYVPSPSTVARDTKVVFVRTRGRLARFLRVCTTQSNGWYKCEDTHRTSEVRWSPKLRHRCMDSTESSRICCDLGVPRAQGRTAHPRA